MIYQVTYGEVDVDEHSLFDVQIKRIHEYKRQLLNILGVIARYIWIKEMPFHERTNVVPRVSIFGGKAAPGYMQAKLIIKLINNVADVINRDLEIGNLLKVVFIPNYNVSTAEVIIPASDISQHISTAGTEASGTSNMKFSMNGGLIIGTLDGANIEIREEAGQENMFTFGALAHEVPEIRSGGKKKAMDERMYRVLPMITQGLFGPYRIYKPIIDPLLDGNDHYLLGYDFPSYIQVQQQVDASYLDKKVWTSKCITVTSQMGKFSSDTTINNYAKEVWGLKPFMVPQTDEVFHN